MVERARRSAIVSPRFWRRASPVSDDCDCLSQVGGLTELDGSQAAFSNTSISANQRFDATDAFWKIAEATNVAVRIAGGANICWHRGSVFGSFPPNTAWTTMHDKYGFLVRSSNAVGAAGAQIHKLRIFNYGDTVAFDAQGDTDWEMCGCYLKYARDDGVEDDFYCSGVMRDCFIDGCYDGVSSREYTATPDGSGNLIEIRDSLIRLQGMDAAFSGTLPNHNAFWKWHANGPQLRLVNVVFRADSPSQEGNGAGMYMAPPPGKLVEAIGCTMCWLGSGSFPETLPSGFTLLTGQEALDFWNAAAAAWLAAHPAPLADTTAPLVSIFTPIADAVLTGTTTLRATAVDDVAVVGVQLKVDGNPVGSEQTVPTDYKPAAAVAWDLTTKYSISWDSTTVANGAHTITATARDAAGNSQTSAGIAVTVSN